MLKSWICGIGNGLATCYVCNANYRKMWIVPNVKFIRADYPFRYLTRLLSSFYDNNHYLNLTFIFFGIHTCVRVLL